MSLERDNTDESFEKRIERIIEEDKEILDALAE